MWFPAVKNHNHSRIPGASISKEAIFRIFSKECLEYPLRAIFSNILMVSRDHLGGILKVVGHREQHTAPRSVEIYSSWALSDPTKATTKRQEYK